MKLAFSPLGCPDWKWEQILQLAQSCGVEGIEIRGVEGHMQAEEIPIFSPAHQEQTKQTLAEAGLVLTDFGTSAAFHNAGCAEEGDRECKTAIDLCSRMGIRAIRIFGDQLPDPAHPRKTISMVGESILELCAYAAPRGVDILLEIHGDFRTIETVSPLLSICKGRPNFGIIWDVEHSDRTYGEQWRPFYETIRGFVRHVHIKDHIPTREGDFLLCPVGEGVIPIKAIVSALEADGYSGYYSLEWEKKWHPELADLDVILPAYCSYMRGLA